MGRILRRRIALVVAFAAILAGGTAVALGATATPKHARPSRHARMHGGGVRARPGLVSAAASYLGLTTAQLQEQLHSGKSLAQIAAATPGKSEAGLIAAIARGREGEDPLPFAGPRSAHQGARQPHARDRAEAARRARRRASRRAARRRPLLPRPEPPPADHRDEVGQDARADRRRHAREVGCRPHRSDGERVQAAAGCSRRRPSAEQDRGGCARGAAEDPDRTAAQPHASRRSPLARARRHGAGTAATPAPAA